MSLFTRVNEDLVPDAKQQTSVPGDRANTTKKSNKSFFGRIVDRFRGGPGEQTRVHKYEAEHSSSSGGDIDLQRGASLRPTAPGDGFAGLRSPEGVVSSDAVGGVGGSDTEVLARLTGGHDPSQFQTPSAVGGAAAASRSQGLSAISANIALQFGSAHKAFVAPPATTPQVPNTVSPGQINARDGVSSYEGTDTHADISSDALGSDTQRSYTSSTRSYSGSDRSQSRSYTGSARSQSRSYTDSARSQSRSSARSQSGSARSQSRSYSGSARSQSRYSGSEPSQSRSSQRSLSDAGTYSDYTDTSDGPEDSAHEMMDRLWPAGMPEKDEGDMWVDGIYGGNKTKKQAGGGGVPALPFSDHDIARAFDTLDTDRNGLVNFRDLYSVVQAVGADVGETDIQDMLKLCGVTHHQQLSFRRFRQFVYIGLMQIPVPVFRKLGPPDLVPPTVVELEATRNQLKLKRFGEAQALMSESDSVSSRSGSESVSSYAHSQSRSASSGRSVSRRSHSPGGTSSSEGMLRTDTFAKPGRGQAATPQTAIQALLPERTQQGFPQKHASIPEKLGKFPDKYEKHPLSSSQMQSRPQPQHSANAGAATNPAAGAAAGAPSTGGGAAVVHHYVEDLSTSYSDEAGSYSGTDGTSGTGATSGTDGTIGSHSGSLSRSRSRIDSASIVTDDGSDSRTYSDASISSRSSVSQSYSRSSQSRSYTRSRTDDTFASGDDRSVSTSRTLSTVEGNDRSKAIERKDGVPEIPAPSESLLQSGAQTGTQQMPENQMRGVGYAEKSSISTQAHASSIASEVEVVSTQPPTHEKSISTLPASRTESIATLPQHAHQSSIRDRSFPARNVGIGAASLSTLPQRLDDSVPMPDAFLPADGHSPAQREAMGAPVQTPMHYDLSSDESSATNSGQSKKYDLSSDGDLTDIHSDQDRSKRGYELSTDEDTDAGGKSAFSPDGKVIDERSPEYAAGLSDFASDGGGGSGMDGWPGSDSGGAVHRAVGQGRQRKRAHKYDLSDSAGDSLEDVSSDD